MKIEEELLKEPTHLDTWAVYGDYLQTQNVPRGEAIALEIELLRGPRNKECRARKQEFLKLHEADWLGPELSKYIQQGYLKLVWKFGFIWKARILILEKNDEIANQILRLLVNSRSSDFLNSLYVSDNGLARAQTEDRLKVLYQKKYLSSIRRLQMNIDFFKKEPERYTPRESDSVYTALPNLEYLYLNGLLLPGKVKHSKIKKLVLEIENSNESYNDIANLELPALEYLSLRLNGNESQIDLNNFWPLFTNNTLNGLHTLEVLGFDLDDSFVEQLLTAPIFEGLKILRVNFFDLTNTGARQLIENFPRLDFLKFFYPDIQDVDSDLLIKLKELYGERFHTFQLSPPF